MKDIGENKYLMYNHIIIYCYSAQSKANGGKWMKIIIVGCGRNGSTIALALCASGNDVTVIDKDISAFEKLKEPHCVNTVLGTGIDEDILCEAGIKHADALIAVTRGDNTNVMIAQIAHTIYKVPNVISRVSDPRTKDFYQNEFGFVCYCPTEANSENYLNLLKGGF